MLTLSKQSCASFLFASVTIIETSQPLLRRGGSALTDAPVVSFTTLLLKATQHTTGLMVKVALLLLSRDLLSSQRQLRWTHTFSFALFGLNQYGQLHKFYLTSTYRTGQTFFKFPNKRKALDVVRQATSDRTKNKRTEKLDEYVNNKR